MKVENRLNKLETSLAGKFDEACSCDGVKRVDVRTYRGDDAPGDAACDTSPPRACARCGRPLSRVVKVVLIRRRDQVEAV
jgi:hypothetical protein